MKKLIIEQLKEGFLFTDENDEKYAVSSGPLSKRAHAYFGLTRPDSRKIKHIAPPAKVQRDATPSKLGSPEPKAVTAELQPANSDAVPETQGSKTAGSTPAGDTSQSLSTERVEVAPLGGDALANENPKLGTRDKNQDVRQTPPVSTSEKSAIRATDAQSQVVTVPRQSLEVGAIHLDDIILHPSDLKLPAFDYDLLAEEQEYKTLKFLELPDGRIVLKYGAARYYTSKDLVMQIQFPFPGGLFSKENGWSSNVEQAFKMYRRYLAERKELEGEPDGTCDDVSFETCANNDPKTCKFCVDGSRYEDKQKIAARKPGAPLLKASWGV